MLHLSLTLHLKGHLEQTWRIVACDFAHSQSFTLLLSLVSGDKDVWGLDAGL